MLIKVIDKFEGKNDFLSNFYMYEIHFSGYVYKSVEHFFQANKATTRIGHNEVADQPTAALTKKKGRNIICRSDWNEIKDSVMELALILKFQNKALREKLLNTGDSILIEGNWWGDTYWGVCEGVGENKLGKLLMKIRDNLREDNKF